MQPRKKITSKMLLPCRIWHLGHTLNNPNIQFVNVHAISKFKCGKKTKLTHTRNRGALRSNCRDNGRISCGI